MFIMLTAFVERGYPGTDTEATRESHSFVRVIEATSQPTLTTASDLFKNTTGISSYNTNIAGGDVVPTEELVLEGECSESECMGLCSLYLRLQNFI